MAPARPLQHVGFLPHDPPPGPRRVWPRAVCARTGHHALARDRVDGRDRAAELHCGCQRHRAIQTQAGAAVPAQTLQCSDACRPRLAARVPETRACRIITAPLGRLGAAWKFGVTPRGQTAHTEVSALGRGDGYSVLHCVLSTTGRTHQIRAHLAHEGMVCMVYPICAVWGGVTSAAAAARLTSPTAGGCWGRLPHCGRFDIWADQRKIRAARGAAAARVPCALHGARAALRARRCRAAAAGDAALR